MPNLLNELEQSLLAHLKKQSHPLRRYEDQVLENTRALGVRGESLGKRIADQRRALVALGEIFDDIKLNKKSPGRFAVASRQFVAQHGGDIERALTAASREMHTLGNNIRSTTADNNRVVAEINRHKILLRDVEPFGRKGNDSARLQVIRMGAQGALSNILAMTNIDLYQPVASYALNYKVKQLGTRALATEVAKRGTQYVLKQEL